MTPNAQRVRAWLWWLIPFAALALLLGIETDWGRGLQPLPGPPPPIEPKPVAAALLPEYRVEGGLGAHAETVSRTLFNPTRRPAPALAAEGTRSSMQKGRFMLTGTTVSGSNQVAFLKEVASGKSRVVRQGDRIDGVLVAAVAADRVRFTQGDDFEELVLKAAVVPRPARAAPQPPTPAAPARPPGAALPGATVPVTPDPEDAPVPIGRRATPTGVDPEDAPNAPRRAAPPATPAAPPAAPAAAPAPGAPAAQGAAASPDPAWNETFERMRQRNRQ